MPETPPAAPAPAEVTPTMRIQVLAAEAAALSASRALAWSESFSRTSMFLSSLSFSGVALALVAQAARFDDTFRLVALVTLLVVLFLGLSTLLRLDSSNYHDALCVVGLNRIRGEYVRLMPDLASIFVMGTTDDAPGLMRSMANLPGRPMALNLMAAAPVLVAVIDGVVLGAIAALLVVQAGGGPGVALGAAIVGLVAFVGLSQWRVHRMLRGASSLLDLRAPGA